MSTPRLLLDGRAGYMTVPDAAALDIAGPFTIVVKAMARAWNTGTVGKTILTKGSAFGGTTNYHIGVYSGIAYCDFWAGGVRRSSTATLPSSFKDGTEHGIGFVWDGNATRIHLDGDLTPAGGGAFGALTPDTYSDSLYIGQMRGVSSAAYWDGSVREIRIFSRALTAEEIQSLYLGTADIRDGLLYEGLLNGTAADTSGNGNHGTVSGAGAVFDPPVLHGIGMRGVDAWWWNQCPIIPPFLWGLSNTWSEVEQALRVSSYSSSHNGHSFLLPIERDVEYKLSAKIKNVAGSLISSFFIVLWQGERLVAANYIPTIVNNDNWTGHNTADYADASITFKIPTADHPSATHFSVQFVGVGSTTREMYFRDLKIEKLTQPANPSRDLAPLFTDAAWVLHPNTSVSPDGETLTLNATAGSQASTVNLAVLPGSILDVSLLMSAGTGNAYLHMYWVYDNGALSSNMTLTHGSPAVTEKKSRLPVPANVRQIRLRPDSNTAGTFTFANLELRQVMPTIRMEPLTAIPADFEQLFTGTWSVENGKVKGVSSGANMPVLALPWDQTSFYVEVDVIPINSTADWDMGLAFGVVDDNNKYVFSLNASSLNTVQMWKRKSGVWSPLTAASAVTVTPGATYKLGLTVSGLKLIGYLNGAKALETADTVVPAGRLGLLVGQGAQAYFSNMRFYPGMTVPPQGYFEELVTNGDFSNGATGWTLHANATVTDGKLVLSAGAAAQETSNTAFPGAPSTAYQFSVDMTASGGSARVYVQERTENLTFLTSTTLTRSTDGQATATVVTGPQTRRIQIVLDSTAAGTFTFDNVSLKRKAP